MIQYGPLQEEAARRGNQELDREVALRVDLPDDPEQARGEPTSTVFVIRGAVVTNSNQLVDHRTRHRAPWAIAVSSDTAKKSSAVDHVPTIHINILNPVKANGKKSINYGEPTRDGNFCRGRRVSNNTRFSLSRAAIRVATSLNTNMNEVSDVAPREDIDTLRRGVGTITDAVFISGTRVAIDE